MQRTQKTLLQILGVLALCAPSVCAADTVYTWDASGSHPTAPTDGAGTWNTSSANWSTGASDVVFGNSTTSQATIGAANGAAGTITVSGTVTVNTIQFNAPGSASYTLAGSGPLVFGGTTPEISIAASQVPIISAVLGDSGGGITFFGTSGSSGSITLNGANTFTGTATVSQATVDFNTLAIGGTASSFGAGANTVPIVIGNNGSFASAVYTGTGGSTDRPWTIGGFSASDAIINNGTGAINFNNTGSALSGTVGTRTLNLKGTYTATSNIFAENISDMGTSPSNTALVVSGGIWSITGANTYSGGTTINSTGILEISAATNLGSGTSITFGSATSEITAIQTAGTTVTIPSTTTITANSGDSAIFKENTSATGTLFEISALITGAGNCVQGSSGSAGSSGVGVQFDNNNNSYTGNFSMGYGNVAYTSVANGGLPSSLGAASTAYTIGNSTSFGEFQYLGSGNTSTTRAIGWTATTGGLTLDSSGTGSVQYLSSTALRTAATTGAATLTLSGTSTGANTLAQVINNNPIAGTVTTSLTKSGASTWILSGANTYTGVTTISGGTLNLGKVETVNTSGPLGDSAASNPGSIVLSGGTLQYSAANNTDYSGRFSTAANQQYNVDVNDRAITWATALTSSGGTLTLSSTAAGGSLTLSGANSYTGITTINSGSTLNISSSNNLGATPASFTANQITLNGGTLGLTATAVDIGTNQGITLAASSTISASASQTPSIESVIAGGSSFVLTKANTTGNLNLNAANTFSGGLTILGGGVRFNNNSAAGTGTITVTPPATAGNTVTLRMLEGGPTAAEAPLYSVTLNNPIVLNANNGVAINVACSTTTPSSSLTLSGNISGTGTLSRDSATSGEGTVVLSGNNSSWTGGLLWYGSILSLGSSSALGTGTLLMCPDNADALTLTATTPLTGANAIQNTVQIAVSNANQQITIGGANNLELAGSVILGQTGSLTPTITNNNTGTTLISGIISGPSGIGLTTAGSGTLTLNGANTYSGNTTIIAGTLVIGATGTLPSTTTVNLAGGTLAMGTFNNTVSALQSNGTVQAAGTWGASGSTANHISSSMTGTGILTVTTGGSSTTTLATSGTPSIYGNSVTFTATVTGSGGNGSTPPGMVTFKDGATTLGTGTLSGSGLTAQATLTISTLAASTHTITASYGGNSFYDVSSTSSGLSQVITAKALTMSGLSVPSSKVYDGTTTATVSGSPGTLTGSESLGSGNSSDGKWYTGDMVSLTGTATGTYNSANVATASSVTFGGLSLTGAQASDYSLTIQSPASATITAATPAFSGLTSPSITYVTTNVTLSGTVSAAGPAYPPNGETINVTINGNAQTTSISGSSGGFSINFNPSNTLYSPNPYTITFSYAGDANFNSASDTSTALTINPPAAPAITTQPQPQTVCSGSAAIFTVATSGADGPYDSYAWYQHANIGWGSAWNVTSSGGGTYLGTSTGNNNGAPDCSSFSTYGDINTPSGNSWGLHGGGSGESLFRVFPAALTNGQVFQIDMDNGGVANGVQNGFALQNSSGSVLFSFYFQGGGSDYAYYDGAGAHTTSVGYTVTGLRISVIVGTNGPGNPAPYSLLITPCGGSPVNYSGAFANTGAPDQVVLYNNNPSGGSANDLFFNNLYAGAAYDNADNYSGNWSASDKGDAAPISGATTTSYTTFTGNNGDLYYAIAYNGAGDAASTNALLTVNATPVAPAGGLTANVAPTLGFITNISTLLASWQGSGLSVQSAGPSSTQGGTVFQNGTYIFYTPPGGSITSDSIPYTVVNSSGCTTTSSITLTFVPQGGIAQSITLSGGNPTINFAGIPDFQYDIQRATDVNGPWATLETITAPSEGVFSYTDTNPPEDGVAYYRLMQH